VIYDTVDKKTSMRYSAFVESTDSTRE